MRWIFLLFATFVAFFAGPASAFGLKTHLWIGQQIINDLDRNCQFVLAGVAVNVPQESCDAIRAHPAEFLAGTLGPDAYPDLITGQVTTHPGIANDWQTDAWIRLLLESARSSEELAFAVGYSVHAASDTFAHSYVNAYSGDIFVLTDERAVERRHFVLEKYIDSLLPSGGPDPRKMKVPARFLSTRLIFNADAARTARLSGAAPHIAGMHAVRVGVDDAAKRMDALERDAGQLFAQLVTDIADFQAKIATGETALQAAELSLGVNEQRLLLEQQALAEAQKAVDGATDAVARNRKAIADALSGAAAARAAISAAEDGARNATNAIADARNSLDRLQNEIASVPRKIMVRECHNVCSWVCLGGGWNPICREACKEACKQVERANGAWEDLNNRISGVKGRINKLERTIAQSAIKITAEKAKLATALQQQTQEEALSAGLAAAKAAQDAAFAAVKARYDVELAATNKARAGVSQLRAEIARLRERLVDTQKVREAIARLVENSNVLSFYFRNWRNGIDKAGDEYILVALDVSQQLAGGSGNVFSAYSRWLGCYGSAFTPVPYQIPESGCKAQDYYQQAKARLEALVISNLPEPAASLFRRYQEIRNDVTNKLKNELENAALSLAKLAAPDPTTADFIELLVRPEYATRQKLDEVFGEVGDAGGKKLLTFPQVSQFIHEDVGYASGRLDPRKFAALRHALTLSRMALLNRPELRRLVWRLGGDQTVMKLSNGNRYSVVVDMLRSIDGNHQWQPYGLPYARSEGSAVPADAQKRRFGYGSGESPSGFPIFVNDGLRRSVFPQLFDGAIIGALGKRPELISPKYPFPSCTANPFPRSFNADGSAKTEDRACDNGGQSPAESARRNWVSRSWRAFLGFFGIDPNFGN